MIRRLLSRLRRNPPTPQQANDIIQKAIDQTLGNGVQGFLIGQVGNETERGIIAAVRRDIAEGLSNALEALLTDVRTRVAAQYAIVTALKATGNAREVQMVGPDDCDCSLCSARRAREGVRQATTTTH